jgi:hypothetical protein
VKLLPVTLTKVPTGANLGVKSEIAGGGALIVKV